MSQRIAGPKSRFARNGAVRYNGGRIEICRLIARLKPFERVGPPAADISEVQTESDVEQKIIYPFLVHPSFLGIPHEWVRTKEYMEPTDIDKSAGKRYGYIPDYSVWRNGFLMRPHWVVQV